ncbi:hypothetical protein [Methyloversatilis sp.]
MKFVLLYVLIAQMCIAAALGNVLAVTACVVALVLNAFWVIYAKTKP